MDSNLDESMDADMEKFLSKSTAIANSPSLRLVLQIARYQLNEKYRIPFLEFHHHVTEAQPEYIKELRDNPRKEYWYSTLVSGILDNVQSSFSCVQYHEDRLRLVESNIMDVVHQSNLAQLLGETSMGVGGASILDFEYQAYVLAYRRCLDQFARAIAAFFKNKCQSFKKFPDFLEKQKPQDVAKALSKVHAKYAKEFGFVFSTDEVSSVRDRIAHYEFVPAGVLNISARGVYLVGGGEELNMCGVEKATLTDSISIRTEVLYQCIEEMIRTFISSVSLWEGNKLA